MNKRKYNRLNPDKNVQDVDNIENINNVKIRVKFKGSKEESMKFSSFITCLNPSYVKQFKDLVAGYCKLFGKEFSKNVYIKF